MGKIRQNWGKIGKNGGDAHKMAAPTRGVWRVVYPSVHRAAAWLLGGGACCGGLLRGVACCLAAVGSLGLGAGLVAMGGC